MPVVVLCMVAGIAIVLWLHGRHWRQKHQTPPQVSRHSINAEAKIAFVVFDSAFCRARYHWRNLRKGTLLYHGDVYEVQYNQRRHSTLSSYHAALRTLHGSGKRYDTIFVVASSMGILPALYATGELHCSGNRVRLIGLDPLLSSNSLSSVKRRLLALSAIVRPGPICNWLAQPIMKRYLGLVSEFHSEQSAHPQLAVKHNASCRRFALSSIIDMGRSIQTSHSYDSNSFADIWAVGVFSDRDTVMDTAKAKQEWQLLFVKSAILNVPNAQHASFIEHANAWQTALVDALWCAGIQAVESEM